MGDDGTADTLVAMANLMIRSAREAPTLRDRFAMTALAGMVNSGVHEEAFLAEWAYRVADAMLAARAKK